MSVSQANSSTKLNFSWTTALFRFKLSPVPAQFSSYDSWRTSNTLRGKSKSCEQTTHAKLRCCYSSRRLNPCWPIGSRLLARATQVSKSDATSRCKHLAWVGKRRRHIATEPAAWTATTTKEIVRVGEMHSPCPRTTKQPLQKPRPQQQ